MGMMYNSKKLNECSIMKWRCRMKKVNCFNLYNENDKKTLEKLNKSYIHF